MTNPIAEGYDPMLHVTRETVVGKMIYDKTDPDSEPYFEPEMFTVIDGSSKGVILGIRPEEGPDTGSNAEITGMRLGSLNIDDLVVDNPLEDDDLEIVDENRVLRINYGDGRYRGRDVTIIKEIKVLIANNATFREGSTFSPSLDRLLIRTPEVTDAASNPQKDVVVETETIITETDTGRTYSFKERMVLPGGYTYIPARVTPQLHKVVPNKVPLRSDGTTELDLWIALEGENFFVHRYHNKLWYPIVRIHDLWDLNPNITEKNPDKPDELPVEMIVLDKDGVPLDGIAGREFGTKILVKIPQGLMVPEEGPYDIQVRNPLRNEPTAYIDSDVLVSGINFIQIPVNKTPNIDRVVPNVVASEGGEQVSIYGGQFLPGVEVYIDGKLVPNVQRNGTGTILTFSAPPGRPGKKQLQVINPGADGGIDVWDFYYVETYTEPVITSFTPEVGTENTLVVIKGENFLKTDPSASDIELSDFEINKILGTRVYLGNSDINEYYLDSYKRISLQDYIPYPDNKILSSDNDKVQLAAYAHSIILEKPASQDGEEPLNYYSIEEDVRGRIIIADGFGNRFAVRINQSSDEDKPFIADKIEGHNQGAYPMDVVVSDTEHKIVIYNQAGDVGLELQVKTPYLIDYETREIVGNRVKVIDNETIYFWVPKLVNAYYDVMVVNPDTKSAKADKQFRYREEPQNPPIIDDIIPDFGSYEGGYHIIIEGENFQDSGEYKTRVFIDGVEISPEETFVINPKQLKVMVPPYPIDRFIEKDTSRLIVPVVVLNSNGGSDAREDGFTYIIPSSEPRITKIIPSEGSAAGGNVVEILGKEFLFTKDASGELLEAPTVYFGDNQAEVLDCNDGYIRILTPPGNPGPAEVYVLNIDGGISNKDIIYTYLESAPIITSVNPSKGRRQGGQWIDIIGEEFYPGKITLLIKDSAEESGDDEGAEESGDKGETVEIEIPETGFTSRVRFGNITNEHIPIDQPNSGWLSGGNPVVELAGGLRVEYDVFLGKLTVQITEEGTIYEQVFDYQENERFINVNQLQDEDENFYSGDELIRFRVVDRRLIVERGYAPEVIYLNSTQLRVKTPSYHTIGIVTLRVTNPDGGYGEAEFEYLSPDSNPYISNITKDGRSPEGDILQGKEILSVRLDYMGGNRVTVIGGDFRDGARILIGDIIEIEPVDIVFELPNRLTFIMPEVDEDKVGQYYRLIVENEDGGLAFSDEAYPDPIYITFMKGESFPSITNITPNRGPAKGGTKVIITGTDFREDSQGNPPLVFFGEVQVPIQDVTRIDYRTLEVITPPNKPGPVEVKVENPDGSLSRPSGIFYYISSPTINVIVDPDDPTETRLITNVSVGGGQQIKIKGAGFEEASKVVFKPEIRLLPEGGDETGDNVIFINGVPYLLVSGTESSAVEFVDSETLVVTVPEGRLGDRGVIVINRDGGASSVYENLAYALPELKEPQNVEAQLIYDRHIRIYWEGVPGATEYEIYAIVDGKGMDFVDSTELTSYFYTDLEPRTDYRFVIKAVGNFGSSQPSQRSNRVTTGRRVGYPDEDGAINEHTAIKRVGNTAEVLIGTDDFKDKIIVIDMLRGEIAGTNQVTISLPASVITDSKAKDIVVIGRDFSLTFNPRAFNNSTINANKDRNDAGVRFEIKPLNEASGIDNGTSLSTLYLLEANFYLGQDIVEIDYLRNFINFTLDFDRNKAEMRRLNKINLNRYDESSRKWQPLEYVTFDPDSTSVTGVTDRLGRYIIIGSRW